MNFVNVQDHVEITTIFSGVTSLIKSYSIHCVLFYIDIFQTARQKIRKPFKFFKCLDSYFKTLEMAASVLQFSNFRLSRQQ